MSTTLSTYLTIEKNLASYQKMTSNEPTVKGATKYYQANIGKVSTIDQFVSNYRLLSYALDAYGLGKYVDDTALVKKVLEGGTTSSKALANTLPNPNWKTFAKRSISAPPAPARRALRPRWRRRPRITSSSSSRKTRAQSDPGVQLALYFKRVAPTVTSGYGIIGDQNLLDVATTALGLSPDITTSQIDTEAKEITNLMPLSELQIRQSSTS